MRLGFLIALLLVPALVWPQSRPIRGGDRLKVACEQEASLNREVTLTQSGSGAFGVLGSVVLAGLDSDEAGLLLSQMLRLRLRVDDAMVRVSLLSRDDLPVRFAGAVEVSGEVQARPGLRLSDIVALARPTAAADLGAVRIERDVGSTLTVDFRRALESREEFDPPVRPGDRVFFPLATSSRDVFVLGGVRTPSSIPFDRAATVGMALESCGGLLSNADRGDVCVLRGGEIFARVDLDREMDLRLQPGDTLRVGLKPQLAFVTVVGAVNRPGRVSFAEGTTLADALFEAGGLRLGADVSKLVVKAPTGHLKADVKALWTGYSLSEGDLVEVPAAQELTATLLYRVALAIGGMAR